MSVVKDCSHLEIMKFKQSIIVLLVTLILTGLPFTSALGIQHLLAHATPEGQAHSEFDLCDWLQIQTTGSLTLHIDLSSQVLFMPGDEVFQEGSFRDTLILIASSLSRAPPIFC